MDIGLLPSGLFMGFSLAVGVGPVNVLCIRRSLTEGFGAGMWSGFGAATADGIFACIVGVGLASMAGVVLAHATLLQVGGAIFLICWGVRVAFARVKVDEEESPPGRIVVHYISTFLFTLLNPANLATFGLAATGLGLLQRNLTATSLAILVVGVFIGSMMWWFLLATGAVTLKKWFVGDLLPIVNKIAGAMIVAFGIALLVLDPTPQFEKLERSTRQSTTSASNAAK